MKVVIQIQDVPSYENMSLKITLPKSWKKGPTSKLQKLFVDSYVKKYPDSELSLDNSHLCNSQMEQIPVDGTTALYVEDKEDVFLQLGPPKTLEEMGIKDGKGS